MGRRYSGPGGTYIVLRDKRTGKFWIHQKNTTHIESGDRELYPTRDAANAKSQMLAEYK